MKSYTIDELNNFDKSALAAIILTMQDQIVHMSNQLDKLTELIAVMNQRQFGKKSEVVDDEYQQLSFFTVYNEAEANADNSDEAPADEIIVNSYKKSKSVGKRKEDLSGLPTKIISHKLSEAELSELFPNGYKELPEQVYTRLTVVPRTFIVEEHHVHVYAPKDEDKKIVRAPRPVDLFRNSIATPSLVAAVITAKYNLHQPLDRQAKDFKASGININTNILANWVIKSSEYYLAMFVDYLHEKLYSEKLLHADETFFKVIRDGKESDAKNYMWVYRNNPDIGSHNIIIYDFQKSRNTSHPLEFLKVSRAPWLLTVIRYTIFLKTNEKT